MKMIENEKYYIDIYNTLTEKYEKAEVTKEVYDCYRRTEWNIDKNDNKYKKHTIPLSCLQGGQDDAFENFKEFIDEKLNPALICETDILYSKLQDAINTLSEKEKIIIVKIFLNRKSERELSAEMAIPQKTINDRKHAVLKILKKYLENQK
jgi:RNA polymerase sigma factor (sigma-70 family)